MRYILGPAGEMADGDRRVVDIGGRSIGVFRLDGKFYAVRNRCPHQAGPLCDGTVVSWLESDGPGDFQLNGDRRLIACPWHGWEYDLETGQSWFDPEHNRVRSYPVTVATGQDLRGVACAAPPTKSGRQPGPYTAEVYDVSVEDEYIVLEVPGA